MTHIKLQKLEKKVVLINSALTFRRCACMRFVWYIICCNSVFYRATRMHCADYAVAKCPSVRLSVRPFVRLSHAGILSKRLDISSKFFSPSGSQTILVFPHQTGWQIYRPKPPNGGVECKGVWKRITIFRPISRFISETMQDRAIVTMEGE